MGNANGLPILGTRRGAWTFNFGHDIIFEHYLFFQQVALKFYARRTISLKQSIFTVLCWLVPNILVASFGFGAAFGRYPSNLFMIFVYSFSAIAILAFFKFRPCDTSALLGGLFFSPILLFVILPSGFARIYFIAAIFGYVIPFLLLSGILTAIIRILTAITKKDSRNE